MKPQKAMTDDEIIKLCMGNNPNSCVIDIPKAIKLARQQGIAQERKELLDSYNKGLDIAEKRGIEKNEEYMKIAEARINRAGKQEKLEKGDGK
jgi:hypothetical protein